MPGTPPTPGPITTPPGSQMPDGFSAKIVCSLLPSCPFWEISPKFGGLDGGAPIKQSTMRSTLWHTAEARTLIMAEDTEVEVAFNPDLYNKVKNDLLNAKHTRGGVWTEYFPDGSTLCYYGWLGKLGQMSLQEGDLPKTTITIHKSNLDASGFEQGPVLTPVTGT